MEDNSMELDPTLNKLMTSLEIYWNTLFDKIQEVRTEADSDDLLPELLDCIRQDLESIVSSCGFNFETVKEQDLRQKLDESVSLNTMLKDLRLTKSE